MRRLTPAHNLCTRIVRSLGIEHDWTITDINGVGFVAADLGTWLAARYLDNKSVKIRIEVRVARDVMSNDGTNEFLDKRNHYGLLGRWVLDPQSGVVALVADIVVSRHNGARLVPEIVAELTNTAETVAFLSGPQRDLNGTKAVTLIRDRRRDGFHPLMEHLPVNVYPEGQMDRIPARLLPVIQHHLAAWLPGWRIEHDAEESIARSRDGSLLLVRSACHPYAGWGLQIALAGEPYECTEGDARRYANALNQCDSEVAGGQSALGCWTFNVVGLEYRVFLCSKLLDVVSDFVAGKFSESAVRSFAARADASLLDRPPPTSAARVLERASWPGDDEADTVARREPLNDGFDGGEGLIYLDHFGRAARITDESFALWRSRLLPQDLADPGVLGFSAWFDSEVAHRSEVS
jgi:hypothetical protein